jgi:hypothetical protein
MKVMVGLRRRWALAPLFFWFVLGTALAAAPDSILDRNTGATISISSDSWVMALEQTQFAATARDFIALYAAEINVTGERKYRLAVFFWSTVLGREHFAGSSPVLTLRIDDRVLRLDPEGRTPRDLGFSKWPLKAPGHGASFMVYEIDEGVLRQMANAKQVAVRPETDPTLPEDVWFEEWRSGRKAFAAFADQVLAP